VATVLLDTTVQLHRIADEGKIRDLIENELASTEVLTTSFAFREFLRGPINDIRFIHSFVKTMPPDVDGLVALSALERFLARGPGNFSRRAARRERLITAVLREELVGNLTDRDFLLTLLERLAETWICNFFRTLGVEKPQAINCLRGLDETTTELDEMRESRPFPSMPPFPRRASEFLEHNHKQVKIVERAFVEPCKQGIRDKPLVSLLKRLKTPNGEFDFLKRLSPKTKGNWHLGDLLITLECPDYAFIFTTDRHYTLHTRCLGKKLFNSRIGAALNELYGGIKSRPD
jgi:hypothetical protein